MLTLKDKLLLEKLQSNFPLTRQPYQEIAKRLGLKEQGVINKVNFFKRRGIIRYIGAIFDTRKLGLKSTLIAMRVPKEKIRRSVKIINKYPEVTHNYLRKDKFNLWFTLSAPSQKRLSKLIAQIKRKTGIREILNLATQKVFKIDARFKPHPTA